MLVGPARLVVRACGGGSVGHVRLATRCLRTRTGAPISCAGWCVRRVRRVQCVASALPLLACPAGG
eukprot:9751047-Alexandrium_andersonii.AAC.1